MQNLQQHELIIKNITNQVIEEIERDIENKVLSISDRPLDVAEIVQEKQKKSKRVRQPQKKPTKLDLSSLQELKHQKLVELKEIERCEDILKRSALFTNSNVSRSFSKLERSQFTEEEVKKVKEILKRQKMFARELKKKEKQLEEWVAEKQRQDEELRKKQIAEKCEERRLELKIQREQLEKKKQERKRNYQLQIKKLKELKQRKLLHQQMEHTSQKAEQQKIKQKMKLYQLQKQKRKNVALNIDDHQKKYLQLKKQKQLSRQKSKQSHANSKSDLPSLHSKFWQKIQKQEEQQDKIKQWQQTEKQNNITKRKIFSKQVKQLFLPQLKPISNQTQPTSRNQSEMKAKPLKLHQQHALGNNYMKTAHESITEVHLQKLKKSLEVVDYFGGHSAFYKNYLSQLKTISKNHVDVDLTSAAFQKTLANDSISYEKKLQKVKTMLQLKQKKLQRSTDAQLVDSVRSKLIVLKELVR